MKAISPLVATAILLVATVAGGIILYNYLLNTLRTPQEYATLTPISAEIVDLGNGVYLVNVKVGAIGSKTITIDSLKILPENITVSLNTDIKPGETKSITVEINAVLQQGVKHYIVIYYEGQSTEPIEATLVT